MNLQSESDVLAYLASATWDLIRSVVILAVLSAAIFRAVLDFGGRALVQRWWIERWLDAAAVGTLTQGKSGAGIFSLDHRQLCAQISTAAQYELHEKRTETLLLRAFVGPESIDDLHKLQSTDSDARAQERLSQSVERQIDMFQAFLAQSMSQLTNDASIAISFGVISLLLALAGTSKYGQLVEITGVLCLVQSVVALGDARIAGRAWVRWLRLLIPTIMVIALVLTLVPVPIDFTPMLLVVISGYSGGMLSPIVVAGLTRIYALR